MQRRWHSDLWIAGGGEKVTLKIAAKYAQYTNFTSEPDGFAHKSQVLAEHCREVGTDYDAIVRSANVNAIVGSTEADVEQRIQRVRDRLAAIAGEGAADAMMSMFSAPGSAAGTPEQVVESLLNAARTGLRVRHLLLPGGGLRPLRHRAVRARGHPGAGVRSACT